MHREFGLDGHNGAAGAKSSGDDRAGVQDGYGSDVDVLSPLVITAVSPAPIPVTDTDGKVHVVYELQGLNASPVSATVTAIDALAGDRPATVLLEAEGLGLDGARVVGRVAEAARRT